jgi:Flp pilus assembly protein CpaB
MRKTIDMVGIASVVSFLLGWVSAGIWSSADEKQPEPRAETQNVAVQPVKVLVAKSDLPMYQALRDHPSELFEQKECGPGDVPNDVLKADELSKLKGKFLKRNLSKGQFVTIDDLVTPITKPAMEKQTVAILLDVDVPDHAFPGSRVDIIWVTKAEGTSELSAKVLLEDVTVIHAASGGMNHGCVISVKATPDDQVRLILAMEAGRLTVIRHQETEATPVANKDKD